MVAINDTYKQDWYENYWLKSLPIMSNVIHHTRRTNGQTKKTNQTDAQVTTSTDDTDPYMPHMDWRLPSSMKQEYKHQTVNTAVDEKPTLELYWPWEKRGKPRDTHSSPAVGAR